LKLIWIKKETREEKRKEKKRRELNQNAFDLREMNDRKSCCSFF
jgi:hypothetical protein